MTKEERTSINNLLSMESVLTRQDIIDIVLVWEGFKPAAMVDVSYFPNKKYSKNQFLKNAEKLKELLVRLGLTHTLNINYPISKNEASAYSLIAKSKSILTKLEKANSEKDDYKRRLKTGRLMGYPESAIKAFAEDKSLPFWKIPENISSRPEFKLLNFRLSYDWPKEIIYLEKKAAALGRIFSKL